MIPPSFLPPAVPPRHAYPDQDPAGAEINSIDRRLDNGAEPGRLIELRQRRRALLHTVLGRAAQ